ncbi:MAG: chemotaxis protein CheB [Bdellovibrio sp.]|jgi:two-component system chemotaxis response regulator CheB
MPFSNTESELIFRLAEKLTGSSQSVESRNDNLLQNVDALMNSLEIKSLEELLMLSKRDESVYQKLISAVSIHTTSWFREAPHFELLLKEAQKFFRNNRTGSFRVASVACSTGEEIYSVALVLKSKLKIEDFERVEFYASDVDPISVETCRRAIYPIAALTQIPELFRADVNVGHGRAHGYFALDAQLRKRFKYRDLNLLTLQLTDFESSLHVILARNVLIYFSHEKQQMVVQSLFGLLQDQGLLVLGHSDRFVNLASLHPIGRSSYRKLENSAAGVISSVQQKRRPVALVIEDSATVRKVVARTLSPTFDVHECASSEEADTFLSDHQGESLDVISLDLNLPGDNGGVWLERQRRKGLKVPVVIVSDSSPQDAERVFGALINGAQEYLLKNRLSQSPDEIRAIFESLAFAKTSRGGYYPTAQFSKQKFNPEVLVIGASTGGPEALQKLLTAPPLDGPPIVIVQHMSPEFNRPFARRLARYSGLPLAEIEGPTPLKAGHLYLADGDHHLEIYRRGSELMIHPNFQAAQNGHRPSVEVLFRSLLSANVDSLCMILTGMGADGSLAVPDLYAAGRCYTMAQDQQSSVVFGMPRKAIETGAVCFVGDVEGLREKWHSFASVRRRLVVA